MSLPTVAIVWRPNVWKSSLFNRFAWWPMAIISDTAWTTRDRVFCVSKKAEIPFIAIDTAWIEIWKEWNNIEENMQAQATIAMNDADIILFLTDSRTELTSEDYKVTEMLRKKSQKPIIFCISKCDWWMDLWQKAEFFQLWFWEPIAISAIHNVWLDDLNKTIHKELRNLWYSASDAKKEKNKEIVWNIALIWRPNVWKSSLVNAFLSEERLIVSDEQWTTRDSVDTEIRFEWKTFNLIDTAWIRRAWKRQFDIEKYSIIRSVKSIEKADVCCVLLDPNEWVTSQDQAIVKMALDAKKWVVLVVNKWDLEEKWEEARDAFFYHLRQKFPFMPWAPVVFVSAKTKRWIIKIFPIIEKIIEERNKRISTWKLNRFIEKITREHQPTWTKNIHPKIFFMSQVDVNPPHFKVFVNKEEYFHFSYWRYLQNRLREIFGFWGTAVQIDIVNRKSIYQK